MIKLTEETFKQELEAMSEVDAYKVGLAVLGLLEYGKQADVAEAKAKNILAAIDKEELGLSDFLEMEPIDGHVLLKILILQKADTQSKAQRIAGEMAAVARSERAKKGARALHAPIDKAKEDLKKHWATGKYPTKAACVRRWAADLQLTTQTADRALRGEPAPDPWPAKPKRG